MYNVYVSFIGVPHCSNSMLSHKCDNELYKCTESNPFYCPFYGNRLNVSHTKLNEYYYWLMGT